MEAAELLEHFQWTAEGVGSSGETVNPAVREEVADVAILLTYLAHQLGIDIDAAVRDKIEINARRYPVESSRGNARRRDQLS